MEKSHNVLTVEYIQYGPSKRLGRIRYDKPECECSVYGKIECFGVRSQSPFMVGEVKAKGFGEDLEETVKRVVREFIDNQTEWYLENGRGRKNCDLHMGIDHVQILLDDENLSNLFYSADWSNFKIPL
jgi:hypothetical protein